MWLDDYKSNHKKVKIDDFIDNVLKKYKNDYKIIHKNYQLGLQKIK